MDWGAWGEKAVVVYFSLSILLEVLDIVFKFTPSKEDDRIIAFVKGWWSLARRYFLLLSIRTPVAAILLIIDTIIGFVNKFIRAR